MRVRAGILIIIGLLVLAGTVDAGIQMDVIGNSSWLVAGSSSSAFYTVTVTDDVSGLPVQGATLTFSVDPAYGTMSTLTNITNSDGQAFSTFTVNTKSGMAEIIASIPASAVSTSIFQNIDHGILTPTFSPTTGTVGEEIPFRVTIKDQWGNPIDNRRGDNTVSLSLTCPLPNDCTFEGYSHSYSSQPDSNGVLNINAKLGTKIGVASIIMAPIKDPVRDIDEQYAYIDTIAGIPTSLTAEISPRPVSPYLIPTVPVFEGVFYFRFTLSDKYSNPVKNQVITIKTQNLNPPPVFTEPDQSVTTNALGQTLIMSYGPKSNVFSGINITGTSANLTTNITVAFTTADPKDMVLSVKPQTMSSLEVEPGSQADVVARVVDNFGNPVSGQNIAFTLEYTPDAEWNITPTLTSYTGITNTEGNVKTTFIPGAFSTIAKKDGSCIVKANWTSKPSYPPKTVSLTWMNYPYVSIFTSVSNETVLVNETVDVTITVVGNGKVNPYGPITVVLDQDTSSNMGHNSAETDGTRLDVAASAAEVFISRMKESTTQIGLETFGKDQNDALGHMDIGSPFEDIINNLYALKGLGPAKEMENSLYLSFNKIIAATSTPGSYFYDSVKAVIMLSDGGSNLDKQEKLSNLVSTANANGIHVFTVSYLNGAGAGDDSNAYDVMEQLANQTGGKHYANKTREGLKDIYWDIANELQKLAAKNSTMSVSFENISVNNTFMGGEEVYDYIPVGPFTPLQTTVNSSGRTSIIWVNGSQTVKDQTSEWPELKFDIGNIEIGQNWSATFRLKVKQPGLIKVFGDGSKISFNGGTGDLILPDLFINVKTNLTEQGMKTGKLDVTDPQPPSSGPFNNFVPLQWNTNYTSSNSANFAKENVYYRVNGGPWIQFDVISGIPIGVSPQSTNLDVRNLPQGVYDIWVHATAYDADPDDGYKIGIQIGDPQKSFIKLQ